MNRRKSMAYYDRKSNGLQKCKISQQTRAPTQPVTQRGQPNLCQFARQAGPQPRFAPDIGHGCGKFSDVEATPTPAEAITTEIPNASHGRIRGLTNVKPRAETGLARPMHADPTMGRGGRKMRKVRLRLRLVNLCMVRMGHGAAHLSHRCRPGAVR